MADREAFRGRRASVATCMKISERPGAAKDPARPGRQQAEPTGGAAPWPPRACGAREERSRADHCGRTPVSSACTMMTRRRSGISRPSDHGGRRRASDGHRTPRRLRAPGDVAEDGSPRRRRGRRRSAGRGRGDRRAGAPRSGGLPTRSATGRRGGRPVVAGDGAYRTHGGRIRQATGCRQGVITRGGACTRPSSPNGDDLRAGLSRSTPPARLSLVRAAAAFGRGPRHQPHTSSFSVW